MAQHGNKRHYPTPEEREILEKYRLKWSKFGNRDPKKEAIVKKALQKLKDVSSHPEHWQKTNVRQAWINRNKAEKQQNGRQPKIPPPPSSVHGVPPPVNPVPPVPPSPPLSEFRSSDMSRQPSGGDPELVPLLDIPQVSNPEEETIESLGLPPIPTDADFANKSQLKKTCYTLLEVYRRHAKMISRWARENRITAKKKIVELFSQVCHIIREELGKSVPFPREDSVVAGLQRTSSIATQILNSSHDYMKQNTEQVWTETKFGVSLLSGNQIPCNIPPFVTALYKGAAAEMSEEKLGAGVAFLKFVSGRPVYITNFDGKIELHNDAFLTTALWAKPTSMIVDSDTVWVAAGKLICGFNLTTLHINETLFVKDDPPTATCMTVRESKFMAAVDGKVFYWDLDSTDFTYLEDGTRARTPHPYPLESYWGDDVKITSIAAVGDYLAVASDQHEEICVYDGDGLFDLLMGHTVGVTRLVPWTGKISQHFMSCSKDMTIRQWTIQNGLSGVPLIVGAHEKPVTCLTVVKLDNFVLLVSGGEDGNVQVCHVDMKRSVCRVHAENEMPLDATLLTSEMAIRIWLVLPDGESVIRTVKFTA